MQVILAAVPMFSGSTYSMMEVRIKKMAAMLDFKMADKLAGSEVIFANSAKNYSKYACNSCGYTHVFRVNLFNDGG
ncbi:MAG: hypothetical protein MJA29_06940, partial [Candidatus Omnitrophica bacterium]|nr:hypothetical protein [Candidatus Omnitrophota bacterium]